MQPSKPENSIPPFPPFASTTRYVALGTIAEAIDRITRAVAVGESISLVVGPPGTGKSLICRILTNMFSASHEVVLLGDMPMETTSDFFRCFLHAVDMDHHHSSESDLQFAVSDYLSGDSVSDGGVLLVLDEAQSASEEVLESVRRLTNRTSSGTVVSAVICGNSKLEEKLLAPQMEAFSQRVATRCYLHAFNAQETGYYISECIRACGSNPTETITDEAMAAVHHACSGVPRLINQMMTQAIDCAAENEETLICERVIDQAWAKLQQLPSPVIEEPKIAHNVSTVEFGELQQLAPTPSTPAVEPAEPGIDDVVDHAVAEIETDESDETVDVNSDRGTFELAPLPEAPDLLLDKVVAEGFEYGDTLGAIVEFTDIPLPEAPSEHPGPTAGNVFDEVQPIPSVDPSIDLSSLMSSPTQLPANLFGEFEEEEELDVREAKSHAGYVVEPEQGIPSSDHDSITETVAEPQNLQMRLAEQDEIAADQALDLESDVENQVIQLSEMVTQARYGAIDPANTFGDPMQPPAEQLQPEPVWDSSQDEQTDPNENTLDSLVVRDDSDLLIIEEEVDVVPRPMGLDRDPSEERAMTVDFQAMLSRMRNS